MYRLIEMDAREALRSLPDSSINCVVTSPPYWRLRDYGVSGQMGLERTPELWTEALVEIFEEVRRVLRADGTCWVNLGDTWASDTGGGGGTQSRAREVFVERVKGGQTQHARNHPILWNSDN